MTYIAHETAVAASTALRLNFGTEYRKLRPAERDALIADLVLMAEDEHLLFGDAAWELRTRIGGEGNLRGYVACLMAGQ